MLVCSYSGYITLDKMFLFVIDLRFIPLTREGALDRWKAVKWANDRRCEKGGQIHQIYNQTGRWQGFNSTDYVLNE